MVDWTKLILFDVQASKLQSTGCCDPSPGGERPYRLYHFLGFVFLRRLFRPASASTSMDLDHNGTSMHFLVEDHVRTVQTQLGLLQFPKANVTDSYFSLSCNPKSCHDQA